MGVRLSTSYRLLDGTNSDIGLTSVVTDGRLRIGNPNVDTSCGPAGQSSIRITVSTAVGSVIVVTVDAAEALRNVRSAVFARRRGIGRRPWSDRHADHPPNRPLTVRRCGKGGGVYIKWDGADYELRPDVLASLRASGLLRICLDPFPRNADRSLSLTVLRCGMDSGPAQIRTAVTATRRPKDTKLPHRPASTIVDAGSFNGSETADRACGWRFPLTLRTVRSRPCPDSDGPP